MFPGGTGVWGAAGFASTLRWFPRCGCSSTTYKVSRCGRGTGRSRLWGHCWTTSSSNDRSVPATSQLSDLSHIKYSFISLFFHSWQWLWRPDMWPAGSSNLWLWRRFDTLNSLFCDICESSLNIYGDKIFHLLFHTEADDEISFNPNDIITNIEMIDEGWWKGQCRGRIGLFPAAYVELMKWGTSCTGSLLQSQVSLTLYHCIYRVNRREFVLEWPLSSGFLYFSV